MAPYMWGVIVKNNLTNFSRFELFLSKDEQRSAMSCHFLNSIFNLIEPPHKHRKRMERIVKFFCVYDFLELHEVLKLLAVHM